jgi:putative lipoic acid-binding regulatory protein
VILDANINKPVIKYPCKWSYKLIGRIQDLIEEEVKTILGEKSYLLTLANKSKTGKFVSLELTVEVCEEKERLELFDRLSKSQVIIQVL